MTEVVNRNTELPTGPYPKIYADEDCRGFAQRNWAFARWCELWDNFGSLGRSHAWCSWDRLRGGDGSTDFCQAAVLSAHLHCDHWDGDCQCVGGMAFRGACRCCDFEGEIRATENQALADAHDHAWPGWFDLPIVRRPPEDKKRLPKWAAEVNAVYPTGWLEQGGPIKTVRKFQGTRWVENGSKFGGFDITAAVEIPPEKEMAIYRRNQRRNGWTDEDDD